MKTLLILHVENKVNKNIHIIIDKLNQLIISLNVTIYRDSEVISRLFALIKLTIKSTTRVSVRVQGFRISSESLSIEATPLATLER